MLYITISLLLNDIIKNSGGDIMNVHDKIRRYIKTLISDGVVTDESCYDSMGVYIKYPDGDISATTDCGVDGLQWLKDSFFDVDTDSWR